MMPDAQDTGVFVRMSGTPEMLQMEPLCPASPILSLSGNVRLLM